MKYKKFSVNNGLYLVIDPSIPVEILLSKLKAAIKGGIDIVQVWDNWQAATNRIEVLEKIATIAHAANIPVLVNEQAEKLEYDFIDGVHFDAIPADFEAIVASLNRPVIMGITAGNDFETIEWAVTNNLDYISFCSVFPSKSVNTCNLVTREIILKARGYTSMPIFLAGGINLNNISELKDTGMNGVALISGIMGAENVEEAAYQYKQSLLHLNNQQ